MKEFLKYHKFSVLMLLAIAAFYFSFGYDLIRSDFIKLFTLYTGLFFLSFKLIQLEKNNFWLLAGLAVIYRFIFTGVLPNLSQDFYRFIWDGKLILNGINPYLSTPNSLSPDIIENSRELIQSMGTLSAGNFTNYPPVNQLFFALSALLGGKSILGSVIAMRSFIIAADLGTLWFGKKLMESFGLPVHRIFWYVLNPFVIIEFTGNLHFEGVMIFFMIWAMYLLHKKRWLWSAILLGISVSVKLLPLIFLPLLLKYFRKTPVHKEPLDFARGDTSESGSISIKKLDLQKLLLFYLLVGITVIISFLPFLSSELFSNFSKSIALWFQKFEFNASIYYIIRWIGFQVKGYNIIGTAGKILPVFVILILGILSFFRKNNSTPQLITSMLLGVSAYFFLSTTVHPWYIATPLILSIFTRYRFAILWSFLVYLSYYAYGNEQFQENLWLVAAEYLLVIGYFIWEFLKLQKPAFSIDI